MDGKKWYQSKTIWANVMAVIAAVGAVVQGAADWQTAIWPAAMGLFNVILRIVTKQPID